MPAQIYDEENTILDVKIVYVRDRNNRKKWIGFICTDLNLSEEEIIALYGKRWNIEVFFKVCKSYLNLGKEFQSLSYDAITAHTAIVMTRYLMLAIENRNSQDARTMGELFFLVYSELSDMQLPQVLNLIIDLMHETLGETVNFTDKQIDSFIGTFIAKLPKHISERLVLKKIA